jgi:hypothetical protein
MIELKGSDDGVQQEQWVSGLHPLSGILNV